MREGRGVLILVLLLTPASVWAQGTEPARPDTAQTRVVTIVNADSAAGAVVGGERIRRLIGNVHLRQDSTDFRARRATQFLDGDRIVLEGDVEIAEPTDTLRARRVTYASASRVGRALGDVRLSDAEAVLYSDSLTFFRNERRAEFDAPVRLEEREEDGVLTSLRGTYFTGRKEAFFQDSVRLVDSTSVLTSRFGRYGTEDRRADFAGDVRLDHDGGATRLRADSLTHYRDTEVSIARGRVAIERFGERDEPADSTAAPAPRDSTGRTLLFGGYAFHDEPARYSRVERGGSALDPLVVRLDTDSTGATDTTLARARTFEALQADSLDGRALAPGRMLRRVVGRGAVRLANPRLAAVADSAVFDRLEFEEGRPERAAEPVLDESRLFRAPVAWLTPRGSAVVTEVSGDTLRITARAEALDSLRALGNAFAARPDSALGRVNQVRGRQMLALFREDSLRAIRAWPTAEAVFFRADSAGALEGAVEVSGDSLSFGFDGDALRRMFLGDGVEGDYFDAALVPEPLRLDGYRYRPGERPTRADLLAGRPALDDPFAVDSLAPRDTLARPEALTPPPATVDSLGAPAPPDTLATPPLVAPPEFEEVPLLEEAPADSVEVLEMGSRSRDGRRGVLQHAPTGTGTGAGHVSKPRRHRRPSPYAARRLRRR